MEELFNILKLFGEQGVIVLLLAAILYAGYREVWVWGSLYRACATEKEQWKALALRGTDIADRAVTVAAQQRAN